jgi:rubrerythrin
MKGMKFIMPNTPYGKSNDNKETASYKTIQEALKLVKQAVQGEREDELFYDYLISLAPTQEEKDIIASIRDDERKHNKMFREIYYYFTGQEIPVPSNVEFTKPATYLEGIKKALFGELSAMERYRIIRAGMPNRYYRDMVFEILTDELKHADKYNYILNINPKDEERSTSMQVDLSKLQQNDSNSNETYDETNDENQFSPDMVVQYITPLVMRAMEEAYEGTDLKYLFQKYILLGVLVGMGYTIDQAMDELEIWENQG